MRPAALLLAVLALGCASTSKESADSRAKLLTDYLDMRDGVVVNVFRFRQACESKKIDRGTCLSFEQDLALLKGKDLAVRALLIEMLRSPDQQIDQDALSKLLEFAGSAAKVAAVAGML